MIVLHTNIADSNSGVSACYAQSDVINRENVRVTSGTTHKNYNFISFKVLSKQTFFLQDRSERYLTC